MTLTQLRYLVQVASTGHFHKAAKACHVTQPTLSAQLGLLERQLGVTLLDRSRHPVVPTPLGSRVVAQARIVLEEHARIHELVGISRGVVQGSYRLGIIPTVASSLIPLFFEPFRSAHPGVELEILELTTAQIIEGLRSDDLDGGIAATPLEDATLEENPLYYEDFHIYSCRPPHRGGHGKVSPSDIDPSSLLLLKDGHCFRDQVLRLCKGPRTGTRGIRYEGGNFQTLMKLVDSGCGTTLIPQLTALALSASQRRRHVHDFKDPVPRREISLVTHRLAKVVISQAIATVIRSSLPPGISREKPGKVLPPLPR
ncbi:MAG: LysR substrate-binding domain-containing protein [Planctomycetota bacterium]